ncbi:MAG TPA: glucosyl-3-phosphoglycerate synthase [Actinomycetota bacterium]|nr:glucosyl-3-phosphoglycerate synthase [Actinomycetota bacterium]
MSDWFARRTFHNSRFQDIPALARAKEAGGHRISVCIPTLNEEATIGPILRSIREDLMEAVPLVDELAIMDSASEDDTAKVARECGADVYQDRDVVPDLEPLGGKGEALWKSLFVMKGDLIAWCDADIENFDPPFITGVLGPLLTDPDVGYVKAFYERPVKSGGQLVPGEGGRVTELVARPLLNTFWPHLAPIVQPLSGEYAGRRSLLEQVPFFSGYGVEIGLVIDVAERFGLEAFAQVDLGNRIHRNREVRQLARMAFAIVHVVLQRLESTGRMDLRTQLGRTLYQFVRPNGELTVQAQPIEVGERPPAASMPEYRSSR